MRRRWVGWLLHYPLTTDTLSDLMDRIEAAVRIIIVRAGAAAVITPLPELRCRKAGR